MLSTLIQSWDEKKLSSSTNIKERVELSPTSHPFPSQETTLPTELLVLEISFVFHSTQFISLIILSYIVPHTEKTRLSQPCDKVVTTMSTIDKVVTTLWIGCHYLVTRL